MIDVKYVSVSRRKADFYESLNLSVSTTNNYKSALQSSFLTSYLKEKYNILEIFEITSIDLLWDIYSDVNINPKNVANHRAYSAAIMKYLRFLNKGNKVGKRIDYGKPKSR